MLRRYLHLLRGIARLPTEEVGGVSRVALARTLLSLAMAGQRSRSRGGSVRILDHVCHALDLRALLYLFEEIFIERDYYVELDGTAPRIIDCGANVGMATLYFKTLYPAAAVTAFEPHPTTFSALRDTVAASGLKNVTLHEAAVAGSAGTGDLFFDPAHPGGLTTSLDANRASGEREAVKTVLLSEFIDGPVDLLKLDVEGAETEVIDDLDRTGRLSRVQNLILEYHHHVSPTTDRLSHILGVLERNGFGYNIRSVRPASGTPQVPQDVLIKCYRKDAE